MKMILVLASITVLVVAANGKHASGGSYQFDNHQYKLMLNEESKPSYLELLFTDLVVEQFGILSSWEQILPHLIYFEENVKKLGGQMVSVFATEWQPVKNQLVAFVESIPAQTIKSTYMVLLKANKATEIEESHVLRKYNPFHQSSKTANANFDDTSFGGSVANMLKSVDKLISKFFKIYDTTYLKKDVKEMDEEIKKMEDMDCEEMKSWLVNKIKNL